MTAYLDELGINASLIRRTVDFDRGQATYALDTPDSDTNTLDLKSRPEYGITDEDITLPAHAGGTRTVTTVSKKEIVLALMQHGRKTEFAGKACDIEAFKDHVGIRQNTVAWAEVLEWGWPNGGPAKWNQRYWKRGTPKKGQPLAVALGDAFKQQAKYEIGCYTATKLVMLQGIVDYYARVKKDPAKLAEVERRALRDGDPLVDVEPGRMWSFEPDFNPKELRREGKVLRIQYEVAPRNFVPGDWNYFLNTDPKTYQHTGYEGSNAIYLGRNKFDDYYNDNNHSYSFDEKLDEVYQWRHGVFSRSRDFAKIEALTDADMDRLSKSPKEGGLLQTLRVSPYLFGYETLPPVYPKTN